MVPGFSPHTTGNSLPTFCHLEKPEMPLEPSFLLTVQLLYASMETPQHLPGLQFKEGSCGRCASHVCFSWVYIKPVCALLYTHVTLNRYSCIDHYSLASSGLYDTCLISWSTRWYKATSLGKCVSFCVFVEVPFPKPSISGTTELGCTSQLDSLTSGRIHALAGSFL